jgi:hypothetical protein
MQRSMLMTTLVMVLGFAASAAGAPQEEGWIKGVEPIRPGLLLVGRNGVCTDAIATAAMGYDPTAGHGQFPFMGDNHLALLADKGIGTNAVDQIEVRGVPLTEAVCPFNPKQHEIGKPIFGRSPMAIDVRPNV